jgi:hypothetical protein
VVRARFPTAACRPCKSREQCTRSNSKGDMGRRITLRPQAEHEADPAGTSPGGHSVVEGAVRPPGWCRRHHPPRCSSLRSAAMPISRPGQDSSATSVHRGRDELPPPQCMVDRHPKSPHSHISPGIPPARPVKRGWPASTAEWPSVP